MPPIHVERYIWISCTTAGMPLGFNSETFISLLCIQLLLTLKAFFPPSFHEEGLCMAVIAYYSVGFTELLKPENIY